MKYVLMIYFSLLTLLARSQSDSIGRAVEPDRETSFENFELLVIAILGLLLLIGLRFWFKRTRKR